MATKLITGPANEPVSLAEIRNIVRVTATNDDADLTSYIVTARERCELILGRSLLPQTWELVLDKFPCKPIKLKWPRIIGITSIKYLDPSTGLEVVLASNLYRVDVDNEPGLLE